MLDQNGEATRDLDKWLHSKLEVPDMDGSLVRSPVPYTTGSSVDQIIELARKHIVSEDTAIELVLGETSQEISLCKTIDEKIVGEYRDDEKVAIAEVLFKAYQKGIVEV